MINNPTIIFDFDGTLAESMAAILAILNRLAPEFGFKRIEKQDLEKFRQEGARDVIGKLGISGLKLALLLKRVRLELSPLIEDSKPVAGIRPVLISLKQSGYRLGILTSNSAENVKKFLAKNDLDFFDFIYSATSLWGKGKAMKKVFGQYDLKPTQTVYVGDETRDIEAAREVKTPVIAVSWGFNTEAALSRIKPDYLVRKPEELVQVIKTL